LEYVKVNKETVTEVSLTEELLLAPSYDDN